MDRDALADVRMLQRMTDFVFGFDLFDETLVIGLAPHHALEGVVLPRGLVNHAMNDRSRTLPENFNRTVAGQQISQPQSPFPPESDSDRPQIQLGIDVPYRPGLV